MALNVPTGTSIQELPDDPNAVSLESSTPEDTAVGLPIPGVSQQPPAPEVAAQRTTKTSMGLGDVLRKREADIYNDYIQGNESMVRKEAATAVDFQKAQDNQKLMIDMANKK